jgi:hypothetical protein
MKNERPTLKEISDWLIERESTQIQGHIDTWFFRVEHHDALAIACAALYHWSKLDVQPIPVSARLPESKDCKEGMFLAWDGDAWEPIHLDSMNWEFYEHHGFTHWLPYWALPIPTTDTKE